MTGFRSTSSFVHSRRSVAAARRGSETPAPVRASPLHVLAWLLVCLVSLPAQAGMSAAESEAPASGVVHVCVDARGLREFRDTPCAPHQRSLLTLAFERVAADPALLARSRDTAREMDRRNAAALERNARIATARSVTRATGRQGKGRDACQAARAHRDDARERAQRRMGYAQRRQLDREVWRRCPNG